MQFAIDLPPLGPFSDPHLVADLAADAEDAGWDGFFLWDHINYNVEGSAAPVSIADPWILLAAIALRTTRLTLGPMITPLARRRPWKVARETVTLDHLSGGVWFWESAWAAIMTGNITTSVSQRIPESMARCSTRVWLS